jgi:hypothetical protein
MAMRPKLSGIASLFAVDQRRPRVSWTDNSAKPFVSLKLGLHGQTTADIHANVAASQAKVVAMLAKPAAIGRTRLNYAPSAMQAVMPPHRRLAAALLLRFEAVTGYTIEFYNPFLEWSLGSILRRGARLPLHAAGAASAVILLGAAAYAAVSLQGARPDTRAVMIAPAVENAKSASAARAAPTIVRRGRGTAADMEQTKSATGAAPATDPANKTGRKTILAALQAPSVANSCGDTASKTVSATAPAPLPHADARWVAPALAADHGLMPVSLALATDDTLPVFEPDIVVPIAANRSGLRRVAALPPRAKGKTARVQPVAIKAEKVRLSSLPSAKVKATVNMRTGPYNRNKAIAVVPARASVRVLRCNIWCKIAWNGKQGFVHRKFVSRRS